MSGGAIVGAAVIGAGASMAASNKASKSASAATAQAAESSQLQYLASQEQLAFQQQQYQDWQDIFGPVQENLSSYYQSLNPDTHAALGIQNIEQEFTRSRQQLDQALAARGITNSGATAAGLTQLETSRMLGRAEARTAAPQQVANQQLGFLSVGLGQQAQLQSGISGAYTNQMSILGQQSSNSLAQAQNYTNQAAQGYAGMGQAIGTGVNTYLNYQAMQPQSSGYYTSSGAVNYAAGYQGPNYLGVQ